MKANLLSPKFGPISNFLSISLSKVEPFSLLMLFVLKQCPKIGKMRSDGLTFVLVLMAFNSMAFHSMAEKIVIGTDDPKRTSNFLASTRFEVE